MRLSAAKVVEVVGGLGCWWSLTLVGDQEVLLVTNQISHKGETHILRNIQVVIYTYIVDILYIYTCRFIRINIYIYIYAYIISLNMDANQIYTFTISQNSEVPQTKQGVSNFQKGFPTVDG